MTFKVGDLVVIDPEAGINTSSVGDRNVASDLSGAEWTVEEITGEGRLLLAGADNQGDIGYDQLRFKLAVVDELTEGYFEPISAYRACCNMNGEFVVEATRSKIICRCSDQEEAVRIAWALNEAKDD